MVPSQETKGDYYVNLSLSKSTAELKMVEREVFLMKTKHQYLYPNEKNAFILPNHGRKRDFVNPCSPTERQASILKMVEIETSISFILMRRICLWCPVMK